jgi:hypothetical protein
LETDSKLGWYVGGLIKIDYGTKDLFKGDIRQNLSTWARGWSEHMELGGIPTEVELFGHTIQHPFERLK